MRLPAFTEPYEDCIEPAPDCLLPLGLRKPELAVERNRGCEFLRATQLNSLAFGGLMAGFPPRHLNTIRMFFSFGSGVSGKCDFSGVLSSMNTCYGAAGLLSRLRCSDVCRDSGFDDSIFFAEATICSD